MGWILRNVAVPFAVGAAATAALMRVLVGPLDGARRPVRNRTIGMERVEDGEDAGDRRGRGEGRASSWRDV